MGETIEIPGKGELLKPSVYHGQKKEQTGRDRPHNYGFEFPEPCVECGMTVTEGGNYRLVLGWLLCSHCTLEDKVASIPHVEPELYEWIAPYDEAGGYFFMERPPEYHPLNGFWVPVREEHAERKHPATGDLVRYPLDSDQDPKVVGEKEVPDWV